MFTNINISGLEESFQYVIEYEPTHEGAINDMTYTLTDNGSCIVFETSEGLTAHIPQIYKLSTIRLYYPEYGLDVFQKHIVYRIEISTWIQGYKIVLGRQDLSRIDALAVDRVKTFQNKKYYECSEFTILDPKSLIYDESWQDFRSHVCHEDVFDRKFLNSNGPSIHVTLYPYRLSIDGEYEDVDNYFGGQGSISINTSEQDLLNLFLESTTNNPLHLTTEPGFSLKLMFNEVYNNSLSEYMYETYGISDFSLQYKLIIGNTDNLLLDLESDIINQGFNDLKPYIFKKSEITRNNFYNWNGFNSIPGINIRGSVDIINDSTDECVISVMSNIIPLTENLYKFFVQTNDFKVNIGGIDKTIYNVKLNNVDMNIYDITAVNKIVNEVVKINRTGSDSRGDMIHPVFFRSFESADIIIHPKVSETISINLDAYKSKVANFNIQIGGYIFPEIGRSSNGVLFKLYRDKITSIPQKGTYYILDSDSELITTGKYTCEY